MRTGITVHLNPTDRKRLQVIVGDRNSPQKHVWRVWRDARLSRNVRQPNRVLANVIGGNKAEWWPRAGEEWLAATKHDGVQVESVLIYKTKFGEAVCQVWSANFNLPNALSLQPAYYRLDVIPDKRGVGPD